MPNYAAGRPAIDAIHDLQDGLNPGYQPEWIGTFRYGVHACDTLPVRTCAPSRYQAEQKLRAWQNRAPEKRSGWSLTDISPLYPFMA